MFFPARFSFASSSARFPVTRLEFAHSTVSSVLDTTSFGVSFICRASGDSLPCLGQYSANS